MPPRINTFAPVTDAELAQAREDPAFRQHLLKQNLALLLGKLQKQRQSPRSATATPSQMREGVTLAVRLAELIQIGAEPSRSS